MREIVTRYGNLRFPVGSDGDIIGRFLEKYGEWAWLETSFLAPLLPPRARVLDAGAFVGTFSLGLSQKADLAWVCAVEADPEIAWILADNLSENLHVQHATVASAVVATGQSVAVGHSQPLNRGSLSFVANDLDETPGVVPPAVIELAELRKTHGPFDLIKLDVEGMEYALLQSDADAFRDSTPLLWVECNANKQALELAELILTWDRPVHYFAFPAFNPDNHKHSADAIFPFAYEAGLFVGQKPPTLSPALAEAGCVLRSIDTVESLKKALWLTPRWGLAQWGGLSSIELVAQASHDMKGESYDDYLVSDHMALETEADRLAQALATAEEIAFDRLASFQHARMRAETAETEWARLEARLLKLLEGEPKSGADE